MTDAFWRDPPWRGGKGGYRMGLRPIAPHQWLPDRIDATERARKQQLIADPASNVFAAIDGSVSGQQKILDAVTAFTGNAIVATALTPPLVMASLIVPDDLCLMEHDAGSYRLTAACVCSPSYWRLTEKIGRTLDGIHGPVPTLNDKLGTSMLQFFDRLPGGAVFERRNWLIHMNADLYHPQSDPWPSEVATDAKGLVVRSERQTLRRLDGSTVVFTIRVSCHPLAEIVSHREAARDLLSALETKDDAERSATGYRYFGPAVVAFLNSVGGGTMTDVGAMFPRVDLGFLPTPLEPLDRLSASLGGPRIWIKRDDCTGLATGGNKTRKLEFLMGHAKSLGADTVITYGAVQSNHARQTAAACAKLGFECHLLLSRRVKWQHPEWETNGNVLLDRLLGAHIHFIEPANVDAASRTLINDLTLLGRHCYVIPSGGSNAVGALGYMRCAAEIIAQSRERGFQPDAIVHATSSGGTQAGLIAGLAAENFECDVIGVNVYDTDHAAIEQRVGQLLGATLNLAEVSLNNPPRVRILHDFVGKDYGIPTQQTTDAIKTLAAIEGVITDPVYSGKAFGGLLSTIQKKDFAAFSNLVFVHTGGVAALPVYTAAFESDQRYE